MRMSKKELEVKVEKTFQQLLDAQKELDQAVFDNNNLKNLYYDVEINTKVKIACLVELGEFANELEFFKYWKKNKRNDKAKQLDEFADVMHFLLSLLNISHLKVDSALTLRDVFDNATMTGVGRPLTLFQNLYMSVMMDQFDLAFNLLLHIGHSVGFTLEEMENAYWTKRDENFARQRRDY